MVEVQKICCFRLSSFALIWGWLGAIGSGLRLVLGLMSLSFVEHYSDVAKIVQFLQLGIQPLIAIFSFFMFISLLAYTGLIISVLKENHKYMLPWIFHETSSIVCEILQIIVLVAASVVTGSSSSNYSGYYHYDKFDGKFTQIYEHSNSQDHFSFLWPCLIFKMAFTAFRIYVCRRIWTLFKNYRGDQRVTNNARSLLVENEQV